MFYMRSSVALFVCLINVQVSDAFLLQCQVPQPTTTTTLSSTNHNYLECNMTLRRKMFQVTVAGVATLIPWSAAWADFTPGGTLVEREVGVTVGNPEASSSRKADNSNVIFTQDNYFKFGQAAPWITPGSMEFPKTMPFTTSQQRYDALKKYGERVKRGLQVIDSLGAIIEAGDDYANSITDPSVLTDVYALRPMGLLANGFMASENTGTTNELLLARWYINEIYLDLGDMRTARSKTEAMSSHKAAKKAVNSYLTMLNRVITSKVGDKFDYLST